VGFIVDVDGDIVRVLCSVAVGVLWELLVYAGPELLWRCCMDSRV